MEDFIRLQQAKEEDLTLLHTLQVEAFMPLYEKYHDDETNPALESQERILSKICSPDSEFYIIFLEQTPVGGVRIKKDPKGEEAKWISPLFIIPAHQNKGIACTVINCIFAMYKEVPKWKLDTIKEEKGNCHLYEKCGFQRVGDEIRVNEFLTLVCYEKEMCPFMESVK